MFINHWQWSNLEDGLCLEKSAGWRAPLSPVNKMIVLVQAHIIFQGQDDADTYSYNWACVVHIHIDFVCSHYDAVWSSHAASGAGTGAGVVVRLLWCATGNTHTWEGRKGGGHWLQTTVFQLRHSLQHWRMNSNLWLVSCVCSTKHSLRYSPARWASVVPVIWRGLTVGL